ncbi:hypothetical protein BV898_04605 [Hypsibius exemplaris]|uniref:SnoaL-like domain-containing protein n=1 Tax=Hypsibius exemplaris TaxID=2072580 RepID=A0A1W0X1Q8_HYPEX|nr:hypothetical protein BV898_04605 [Hypsibius exemplaris]
MPPSMNSCSPSITVVDHKKQIFDLLKAIETGDPTAAPFNVIAPTYIQHNLGAGDTKAGILAVLPFVPKTAKVTIVRVFQDGEFVFAHSQHDVFGSEIAFDVYRFEDGLVVEHWDNLQATPNTTNPSGRSMIDGAREVEVVSAEVAKGNKALVRAFVEEILVNNRLDRLESYFDGDDFLQHSPGAADGVSGLIAAIESRNAAGKEVKYNRIRLILGEGDFVLTASEGTEGGVLTAFYDLFRMENGKLAEHWDVVEPILPRDQWKNNNARF